MMQKIALGLAGLFLAGTISSANAAASPALSGRPAQAAAYFEQYCLTNGGNLAQAIAAFAGSKTFGNQSGTNAGRITYASFTGPDGINASVKIGFSSIADHCSIIVIGAGDAMALSKALADHFAGETGPSISSVEPFADYGEGGYAVPYQGGQIIAAPMTTGIQPGIVHINFFP
ncbi:subtilisin family serine protease [Rhodopseudomonas julia]|uniref:Subtilisin family serine protease n=1 Tax=Rhodopseudomonas julia TaxID=200617 RepID=A0ABU0C921_9BRAD|nr:hypothetical protein [Rhodopseudomonas julia]MDQ0326135.1 subtilisin family serine protease [Rhodopseudomonas julia]